VNGQPTEEQELFFDETLNKLSAFKALAESAEVALGEGDFDAAVSMMDEGCCLVSGRGVWESVTRDVIKIRDISDEIEKEES